MPPTALTPTEIAPVTSPVSLIDAVGVFNLRDLGIRLADAGLVSAPDLVANRVFRADGLHRTDAAGQELVAQLGIRRLVDLRSSEEAEGEGRFQHTMVQVDAVPIVERISDLIKTVGVDVTDLMLEHYFIMARDSGAQFAAALGVVADALDRGEPVVFHCAAGKDRTGLVAALLLGGLGVPDDHIAADYAQSALALPALKAWFTNRGEPAPAKRMKAMGLPAGLMKKLMVAEPATMLALLSWLREQHGSVEGYLAHIGARDSIATIRRQLLQAPAS